ncbi:MAG: phage tail tape measure protein [Candidatus Omnitrophica bacterium]|nr:phage tail tape measure protein [Candidatus Omnitrophota bacterium]
MAGSLGELVVSVTTNLTNLNAGLKKAEESVRNTTGKITDYTNKIGVAMTAAGAVITGAFALMIKSTTDYADQIYDVSQRTGLAVEALSELKYVAEQTESSFEAVANGIKFLSKNIYEATNGNKQANDTFRTLGISLRDEVTGSVLTADQAFLKIADRFKDLKDNTAKTALSMELFGRQGSALIPVLNLGSEGIQRLSQEAKKLGLVLTTENAKAIDEFSDKSKSLQGALSGLWLNISLLVIPALEKLIKFATDVAIKLREWSEKHPVLSKFLAETTLAIGALFVVLGPLILIFNQVFIAVTNIAVFLPILIAGVKALAAAFMFLVTTPVGLTITGIALAIGLLAKAWSDNWGNIREVTKNAIDSMIGWLKELINVTNEAVNILTFGLFKNKETSFGGGATQGTGAGGSFAEETPSVKVTEQDKSALDETVNKVADLSQKLKEVNEEYLTGKINVEEYYNSVIELHSQGLDIKQQELDLLQQLIDMEYLATDAEYQKIYVMQQGIQSVREYYQVEAELANQDLVNQQSRLNSATGLLQTMQSMHKTVWGSVFDFMNMGLQKFSSGFSTAISSIILGTKSASEAFKEFGMAMVTAIVEFVVQYAVQAALALVLGSLIAKFVDGIAGEIAAAWLPGAILASIATFGGAAAAGTAAVASGLGTGIGMLTAMKGVGDVTGGGGGAVTLGEGGIVTRPTFALVGESGPEAVIPLDRAQGSTGNNVSITINNPVVREESDIQKIAEAVSEIFSDEADRIRHG